MKILVVEDERRIANTIKKGLKQERYAVDVCYTGSDGFDMASSEEYDCIILDLMLPEMDGLTICKKLRESKIHTPIIMLTAKGQTQDKIQGLNSGGDDYLTKPFAFEELLARIKALTRRPKVIQPLTISIGDLSLNSSTFQVKRGDTEIKLTSKEFSLLEYLLRNSNKVLTKDQIISHVWDYDADILPNTVEVYIRNLRNKIDQPFKNSKPTITTVRGFGYKLCSA